MPNQIDLRFPYRYIIIKLCGFRKAYIVREQMESLLDSANYQFASLTVDNMFNNYKTTYVVFVLTAVFRTEILFSQLDIK